MSEATVITLGPNPWQVVQRTAVTYGELRVSGTWQASPGAIVEVRVVRLDDGMAAAGCHWQAAETAGDAWSIAMRVPTGGPYRLETRVRLPGDELPAGGTVDPFFVGDVWVIAGQSNAAGFGRTPHLDPPMIGVSLYHASGRWRLASHPLFDATGSIYPANRHTILLGHSPWLAFGKMIKEKTGVPIGLIPAALGGSGLDLWEPRREGAAPLWDNMLRMVEDAGGGIAGVVWYQGETDAFDRRKAETYLERFQSFVQRLRERFGPGTPILIAQLDRVISPDFAGWPIVSEAQRQAARTMERVAVIPTVDLPMDDNIHVSSAGCVILGHRFAQAALEMVYAEEVKPGGWLPSDLESAAFVDAGRTSIRLRFSGVGDGLISVLEPISGLAVEDEEGVVEIARARLEGKDAVVLELARPARGKTLCHHAADAQATTTLRDGRGWPPLAFWAVEVQG